MGGCNEANKRIFFKSICHRAYFFRHIFFSVLGFDARIKKTKNL